MSFLQPLLLIALPLAALPILIHLVNQYRYQSVRWGAMMFLLAAQRMSRGYTKLRQWLILLFRVLALLGLILAVSRPLSSGWLGWAAGGRADTTLILLDRSPSMQQLAIDSGITKLDTGQRQLVDTLRTLGPSRWVLLESPHLPPRELGDLDEISQGPRSQGTSVSTDIPALLESARQYIEANQVGRTDIWICSDLRDNDWLADSGRWDALRDSFRALGPRVRFHLLAYPQTDQDNLSIRVTQARVETHGDASELVISVRLRRDPESRGEGAESLARTVSTPIEFEVDGVRSVHAVEWSGPQFDLQEHRIPLAAGQERGWGRVSLPADANPSDNFYYFAFGPAAPRKTLLVAESEQAARPLELAASIASAPEIDQFVEIMTPQQLLTAPWEEVALLLWQGELPSGETASLIEGFLDRGGRAIFFPPQAVASGEFLEVRWQEMVSDKEDPIPIATWRGDQDLLAHTLSGAPLPVGQIQVRRHVQMTGPFTTLAALEGSQPFLARAIRDGGGAYFLATTPAPSDSSLASDGVVLYVLLQRALAEGAERLGNTRQMVAAPSDEHDTTQWQQLEGNADAISTEFSLHSGVYTHEEKLLALNRSEVEDHARVLDESRLQELFEGLDMRRIEDQAGSLQSLVQEIWRLFLISMLVALMVEAGLSLPKRRTLVGATP